MAVYTEVNDDELAALIASYGLGELLSYKGIAEGVENTNYLLHTSTGAFILTLYERRVAASDLPFFLGLVEHLSKRGVSCPLPVRNLKGEILSEISRAHGGRSSLSSKGCGCAGQSPSIASPWAGRWRSFISRAPTSTSPAKTRSDRTAGMRCSTASKDRADEVMPGLRSLIASELRPSRRRVAADLPSGVIHADLFPDNVFFLGDTLSGLIDFYFACNDALAYDIAICLNAWCFEPDQSFNVEKGRALLQGYQTVRTLTPAEREALPTAWGAARH